MCGILKEYSLNSTLHGLRYAADNQFHFTERIFWTICVILSWIGSAFLMLASWDAYENNALSFVVETSYLDWNTDFPTVILCETDTNEVENHLDRLYGVDEYSWNLEDAYKELVFFKGAANSIKAACFKSKKQEPCPQGNFTALANTIRKNCTQMLSNCQWNGVPFDCCEQFLPLETELGVCYAINSLQTSKSRTLNMSSSIDSNLGTLIFNFEMTGYMYVLSNEEVPTYNTITRDILNIITGVRFIDHVVVHETENEHDVHNADIQQRNCRYTDENDDISVHKVYSYSACLVETRKKEQMKLCNCTHHFMPNTHPSQQCDLAGLLCLYKNSNKVTIYKTPWSTADGISNACLSSCSELEVMHLSQKTEPLGPVSYGQVEISFGYLPSERFKRTIVRDKLDLVVSLGGTAGLFVGASALSLAELIYYLFIRPFGKKDENKASKEITPKEEYVKPLPLQMQRMKLPIYRKNLNPGDDYYHGVFPYVD